MTKEVIEALSELVALPNVQGWLSLDVENYLDGLAVYQSHPNWKVAVLQQALDEMPPEMMPTITGAVKFGDLVSFPYHHGGRHVEPIVGESIVVCPQVMGVYPLEKSKHLPKPCQLCGFCLP
jgi:hypothetical protein